MKRRLLLLFVLFSTAFWAMAERIDVATARRIAENVAASNTGGLRSASELSLIYAAAPGQEKNALRSTGTVDGATDYFVFNIGANKGFVIVSGDDRVRPVLGYSDEGNIDFDNLPDNLRAHLAYFQSQISWVENKAVNQSPEIALEWSRYLSGTTLRSGGGVLLSTANWSQEDPYNRKCPLIGKGRALTGCVATAMGIIMKYHEYPAKAVNPPVSNSYKEDGSPVTATIDYSADYDWNNMLDDYRSNFTNKQGNAVATLLYHCGANVEMDYGVSGSGANTPRVAKALSDVFGYSPEIRFLPKEAYRWKEWKAMIREELDARFPLIYDGVSKKGGHAFVCDGYDANGLFHINWGWGGYSNGYFQLSVLDDDDDGIGYSEGQGAILHIRSNESGERYYIAPYLTRAKYKMWEQDVFISFDIRYYALYDKTFCMELGVVNADGTIAQQPSGTPTSVKLEANVGGWHNYSYERSLTLSSSLSDGQYIALLCSADEGKTWEVMRSLETVPLGINSTGVINPSKDDPTEPEQTMNVNINWNQFDRDYLPVSELDNSGYHYDNVKGVSYQFSFVKENVILRYKISNYSEWKNHISVYYGTDYSIGRPQQGTPLQISDDGTFEIKVAKENIHDMMYVNYLKVFANRSGVLTYDMEVLSESVPSPAFKKSGNEMTFVNPISGSIAPNPITGQAGVEIPFTFTIGKEVDSKLSGKELSLFASIQCYITEGVKLYLMDGEKKKEVNLTPTETGTILNTAGISVGSLIAGQSYSFKLLIPSVPVVPAGSSLPYIFFSSAEVAGQPVAMANGGDFVGLSITSQAEKYYQIKTDFTHVQLQNGITQIKEGEDLFLTLVPEAGYALPSTITVKVGGTELGGYTYNSSNGYLRIAFDKITGDIEIIANGVEMKNTYTVTSQFTGLSVTGWQETVTEGDKLTFTLSANEGYVLPETIIVKMGGTILTGYTYNQGTGEVIINNVNGAVEVIAEAVKKHTVTTTFSGVSATTEVPQTVLNGKELAFTLQASEGYKLPETITVTMGGNALAPETDYTYEQRTGTFKITKVTGNVVVTVEADRYYTVSNTITNLTVTPEILPEIKAGGTITFTLKAETGYKLPKAITVTMDGDLLTVGNDYTYNVSTGEVSITPVQGDIQITATGEAIAYYKIDVTTNIKYLNVKEDVPTQVEEGGSVSFTLTPDENYKLPTAVTVTMGDKSADFTYDAGSGQVSIKNIQGDIVVTAIGIDNSQQEVIILPEEGLIVEHINPVKTGEKVELTLKVEKGYTLPETIVVTMGGNNLVAGTEYTYDATTGTFTLQSITGELRIKVVPVKVKYDVTATLTHLTASIAEKVAYNDPLSFMLVPEKGYKLPATITVEMGASTLQVGDDYSYNTTTGEVKIKAVTDVVKIKAVGVELSKYTITMALTNLKSDKKELTVYEGESFTFKLIPDAGYRLPETIAVTGANGAITGVVYNSTSGEVKIPKVKEALTVTAVAKAIPTYAVEFQLTDVTTDWEEDAVVQEEGTLRCTLKAKTGFLLPTSITVTMGGVDYKDYTYDAKTGKVEVRNVKGKVVIVAVGLDDSMRKVALSLSHVSSKPSPTEVPVNSQLELVFTADNGYKLPETIKVSMGNKTLTADSDYTYNKSTGKFTLAKVTGNVEIIVIAELIQTPTPDPDPKPVTYTVTLPVIEGVVLTSETGTAIKENEDFIFTITLKDGYKNSKPVVKANGKEILPDSKGRYVVKNVKTNITITVSGIVKDDPTANLEIQGSLKVWGADGHLHILSSKVGEARVITYSGQLYKIITLTGGETITSLPSGIYIVRIDGQSYKVYLY